MKKWQFFSSDELKPAGWLRRQLEIQAGALSGNLDKIWPDIRDSAWIGGYRDGWERVPYRLDGFIPLAYLLEDGDMIARAKKYIDATPVTLKTSVCKIDWGYEDGYETVCAKLPGSRVPVSAAEDAVLIPYGCTMLRMTMLPEAEA